MGNHDSWKRGDRLKTGEEIKREREWKGDRDKRVESWDMGVGPGL